MNIFLCFSFFIISGNFFTNCPFSSLNNLPYKMTMQNSIALLSQLNSGSGNRDDFESLYILVCNLEKTELLALAESHQLTGVFRHIDWTDRDFCDTGLSIAKTIFSTFSWREILATLDAEIAVGLNSSNDTLSKFFLQQLASCFTNESVDITTIPENIVLAVISHMGDESLDSAALSGKVLKTIAALQPNGIEFLLKNDLFLNALRTVCNNPEKRLRLCEMAIDIASLSRSILDEVANTGLLDDLITQLQLEDILVHINCLELTKDLVAIEGGLDFLEGRGALDLLERRLTTITEDPFGELLLPGYLTLFGRMSALHPQVVLSRFPLFLSLLRTTILSDSSSPANMVVAAETYGHICRSVEGKLALKEASGSQLDSVLAHFGGIISSGPVDLRGRTLDSLRYMITVPSDKVSFDVCQITFHWFKCVRGSYEATMRLISSLASQPFLENRIGAIRIFKSMANQRWGQEVFCSTPGFLDYLVNRSSEHDKPAREEKFAIFQVLAGCPFTSEVMGAGFMVQVALYLQQGPFFVRPQAEVDFAEA